MLPARVPRASFEVLIDARSGRSVRVRDLLRHASGTARVFDTNAVVEQGSRRGLSDAGDADSGVPSSLYTPVTLKRLSGTCLTGSWVRAQLGSLDVCDSARDFQTTRSADRFEPAMAYFHVDRAQQYIRGLGFTNVFARPLTVHANDFSDDNSYFDPFTDEIALGSGGVDDGEDGEVILHEYGHAIQDDQVEGFGWSAEGGAMGEGFGDYLAAAIAATYAANPELDPCVAEWDSLGYQNPRSCLRRTDRDLTAEQVAGPPCFGEVHCAGEAWSAALWDIRSQLGGAVADRLVIQSHFSLTATADFHEGSAALLGADGALNGGAHQAFLRNLLSSRGLLDLERLDGDGDGRPDRQDNCPAVANPRQSDWNRDGRGDVCDGRAQVTLESARARRGEVILDGRARPASLIAASDWRVRVQRRACRASGCRWQAVTLAPGKRKVRGGQIRTSVTLRGPGLYRFQALLRHPRLIAPRSAFKALSLR
ncbi:MAG: M36 family metallopeptidase [Thermoleophilaceae bacterium]|nr:M36 family metallopeptidase [Thermoleophilaceae bacterium]